MPANGPPRPPRVATWILSRAIDPHVRYAALGDFEEIYDVVVAERGRTAAGRWYWRQALRSLPAFLFDTLYWTIAMLKNYVTVTLRNLRRQKGFAFINVISLAVGLALCALIALYVRDELTFDRFHEKADRIVRVNTQIFADGGAIDREVPWQPMPLGPALVSDLPEVEAAIRFASLDDYYLRVADRTFKEHILFADAPFFDVFTFPLLRGDPATALQDPNSIVLSPAAAKKYFGEADPLGQTMQVRLGDTFESVVVTGVAKPTPPNSTIQFDYLMPFAKLPLAFDWIRSRTDRWTVSSFFVYALLKPDAPLAAVQAKMRAFRATYLPDEAERARAHGRWHSDGPPRAFHLQPLKDVHLDPSVRSGLRPASNPLYSYILGSIALGILLIACINFMTLSMGRSARRAREVGMRKVIGALRRQIMLQFWGEAILMVALALMLGLVLAWLFLPTFNTLADKQLHLSTLAGWQTAAALVGLALVTGLVAGSYPALVLSGIQPIETLRRKLRLGGANPLTRGLVVVQFALTIFLIAGTLMMTRQLTYMQHKSLGYDRENVVIIPTNDQPGERLLKYYRQKLAGRPDVLGITAMNNAFTHGWSKDGWNYRGEDKTAYVYRVETNFADVMGLQIVDGRDFDPNLSTDSTSAVLVNEALVKDFGWADPIGQKMDGFYVEPTVVGVVKDFNFLSLHEAIEPAVLTLDPDWGVFNLMVRIAPGNIPATLDALRTTWNDVSPDVPFQYSFLDQDLDGQYQRERRWNRIVGYASGFAILIACLGLFGLASLTVAARRQEIGVRKVMGATSASVARLFSGSFLKLVAVAFVVATPLAYLAVQRWLQDFAYRAAVSWWVFVVSGLAALAVALATVGYQALRAARTNPVETLRYE